MNATIRYGATVGAVLLISASLWSADKDLDAIQGTWRITAIKLAPPLDQMEPQFSAQYAKVRFVIKGDIVTSQSEGKPNGESARLQMDSRPRPKIINLVMKDEAGMEKSIKGVYSLDGDKLRICFGFETRPRKVHDKPTEESFLVELERVKSAPKIPK